MATRQAYGTHHGLQGPLDPVCVPISGQSNPRGAHRLPPPRPAHTSSCLFVLPGRPSVKVKVGAAYYGPLIRTKGTQAAGVLTACADCCAGAGACKQQECSPQQVIHLPCAAQRKILRVLQSIKKIKHRQLT
jgi:hypothetical protein